MMTTMDGHTSDTLAGCSFDILTEDALIIIFSFLSLYERLMAMRINKRCHRILSNPQSWTHLDFWQVQKTKRKLETGNQSMLRKPSKAVRKDESTWVYVFPSDEEEILIFLKKYTSASIKSLFLHSVSKRIMAHVQQTYVNLETISFLSADEPPRSAIGIGLDEIDSSAYLYIRPIPHNHLYMYILPLCIHLRVLEISLRAISCTRPGCKQIQNEFFLHLTKCKRLRRLKIIGMDPGLLTSDGLGELSQELGELSFLCTEHATIDEYGDVTYHDRISGNSDDDSSKLCHALLPLLKLTKVNTFKLSAFDPESAPESAYVPFNIDEFLSGIAWNWQHLRRLTLIGVSPPPDGIFLSLISALSELRELELYGAMISDKNIAYIARYLTKLTTLKLSDGHYTPSGIKGLRNHPSIENLSLLEQSRNSPAPEWLFAVYEVILSLPKLVYVKILPTLLGYRVIGLHATKGLPEIPSNIKLDV